MPKTTGMWGLKTFVLGTACVFGCGAEHKNSVPATNIQNTASPHNTEHPEDKETPHTDTTPPSDPPTPPQTDPTPPSPPPPPATEPVCAHAGPSENFNNAPDPLVWKTYGSAHWETAGYLELTGNAQGRKGAIFNMVDKVSPGNIDISVRLWTGGGTGADGFAMSIIGADSPEQLNTLIEAAQPGSGLGYAYGPGFGGFDTKALHVEFDTWENKRVPNGDLFDDPTSQNHIEVTLDGNPGQHYLWGEAPHLEDAQWHDVKLRIRDEHIDVSLDNETVLEGVIPGFRFKGGYIGFTGSTGYYTNFHKIDDLKIPCIAR